MYKDLGLLDPLYKFLLMLQSASGKGNFYAYYQAGNWKLSTNRVTGVNLLTRGCPLMYKVFSYNYGFTFQLYCHVGNYLDLPEFLKNG